MTGGWWMTAKPGDKVACVDDGIDYTGRNTALLQGQVYVIEAIIDYYGQAVIVASGAYSRHSTRGYRASRSRPVQTKSTDTGMAILKRILERPEQRIEEDA